MIYWINHTKKFDDYENIHSLNPFYLIINKADGYIKESNGNKYLILDSTDKNNEVLTKYTDIWLKSKYLIKTINDCKTDEYEADFMKIKCN